MNERQELLAERDAVLAERARTANQKVSARRRAALTRRDLAACRRLRELTAQERAASAPLAPLPAQLDLDGNAHEIAPETERMRLFEPAPSQLAGQTHLTTPDERQER